MSALWEAIEYWPVRAALAGGLILLVGRVLLLPTRQPARRALIGTATVAAALLVLPLSLLPGWLPVRVGSPTLTADASVEAPNPEPSTPDAYAVLHVPLAPAAPAAGAVELAPPVAAVEPPPAEPMAMAATTAVSPSVNWWRIAMGGYGALVALLVVRLGVGQVALSRRWRAGRPVPDWAEQVFRELAAPVCPRAQLRASGRAAGPVCFGVLRPRVLVPASLLAAGDGPELRAVLAHELGHLCRRDPLTGWFLGLARAVYFVWPWLAGLRREVRLAQEIPGRRRRRPDDWTCRLRRNVDSNDPGPAGAIGRGRGPWTEF
jgi:beta-lactamase regulating signal transducer with metallopeptidase domain